VWLWDIVTGRGRHLTGHRGAVFALAFAPDGKTLATAGADTSVLLWEVTVPLPPGPTERPSAEGRRRLWADWADLTDPAPEPAFRAVRDLAGHPGEAVPFLRECCRPGAPLDPVAVRLVADLDDDDFDVRTRAMPELERLADRAEPALHAALTRRPSLEQRRRIDELFAGLARTAPSAERLRAARVVEALELSGTPEALRLLGDIADGSPLPWLASEGRGVRERRK
jgi:hypothetical protein